MTESTAIGTRGYNTNNFRKYSSIGLLAPNIEAKVVDWTNGSLLPPGSTGELLLRSPGNMKGNYFLVLFLYNLSNTEACCSAFYNFLDPIINLAVPSHLLVPSFAIEQCILSSVLSLYGHS